MAAGDINVTVVGNLTNDPELRFTPSGAAVASFTVATSSRYLDKTTNEWKDGEPTYLRCSVWRQYAENVAESLTKGPRVMVSGTLKQRSYETREGDKRTVMEVEVEDVMQQRRLIEFSAPMVDSVPVAVLQHLQTIPGQLMHLLQTLTNHPFNHAITQIYQ